MITYEQFDNKIDCLHGDVDVYFDFLPEKEIKKPYTITNRNSQSGKVTDRYHVVHFLYGRLRIGNDSYFAEICGYSNPNIPLITTYHIIVILEKAFFDKYFLNSSESSLYRNNDIEVL